jgi:hypothetical protein
LSEECHDWKEWKHFWKKAWKDQAMELKKEFALRKGAFKGKGKGKGKGKWAHWWHFEDMPADPAADDGANSMADGSTVGFTAADGSEAGESAPPGLELPQNCWGAPWWAKGKSKGKRDWASGWPWGTWPGMMMQNHCATPPFWHWGYDAWPSDSHWGQMDGSFEGIPTSSTSTIMEGRQDGHFTGKTNHEQIEGDLPN